MQTSFRFRPHWVLTGLISLCLAACGGGGSSRSGGGDPPPQQTGATPTAVGNAVGTPVSQTIGAAGGRLDFGDGQVVLDVPAGALTQDTEITLQPITNHAHGGAGRSYRFGPEDVRFASPVTLTFRYSEGDVAGSAPEALGIAYQRADRVWEWVRDPVVDPVARTVQIQTDHFSDWSLVRGLQLLPHTAMVRVGRTLGLRLGVCYPSWDDDELRSPLGHLCDEGTPDSNPVEEWAVNGVVGGNGNVGTVAGATHTATFTAPASKPEPDSVAVSARIANQVGVQLLLISNVTIVDDGDYAGTVDMDAELFSGTAQVSWKKVEDTGDTRQYAPSGTMTLDIRIEDCNPARRTVPIDDGYATTGLGPFMQVYTEANVAFPRTHYFSLRGKGTVMLDCGEPREAVEVPANIFMVTGMCTTPAFHPYLNEEELQGSYGCPEFEIDNVSWHFRAQQPQDTVARP